MSKLNARVLLIACLAGAVIFTICFQATKSPSLRVGTTIRDPQEYFTEQLKHQPHLPLRVSTLTSQPGGLFTYNTRFVFLGCEITSRTSTYRFDTNGTVLSIYTRRYWPIFHF
jgi:hypothetical protein